MESAAPNPQPRFPNYFADNCLAANLKKIEASPLFRCQKLLGHTKFIETVEFSEDGTLLISGGQDEIVRLWSLNGEGGGKSIEMETKQEGYVLSLAFSSDNNRIFSGGRFSKVFVHDTQT